MDLALAGGVQFVVVGAIFAFAACVALFRLRGRMAKSGQGAGAGWLFLCGLEAGAAIWSAQLLHLLSHADAPAGFDPMPVLASLVTAVAGSAIALGVAWNERGAMARLAGVLLFVFTAMAARYIALTGYVVAGSFSFEPWVIWCAVVAGSGLCVAALWVAHRTRDLKRQLVGAALLTLAVNVLQHWGMRTTVSAQVTALPPGLIGAGALLVLITAFTVVAILVGYGVNYIDNAAAEDGLRRSRRLADATREGIVVLDGSGRIADANTAFARLAGHEVPALRGRPFLGDMLQLKGAELRFSQLSEGVLHPASGPPVPVEVHASPLADDLAGGVAVAVRDLRERLDNERLIRHLAEHDSLTGLVNRDVLQSVIRRAVDRATPEQTVLAVCINVDNSREVNEMLGHAAGDALLAKVAERLKHVELEDARTAGRIGGNEFGLAVVTGVDAGLAHASDMLHRLGASLREPFIWQGRTIEPRVSIGVAGYPHDARTAPELLLHAALALKEARESGESFCFFSAEYQDAMVERRALLGDLQAALTRGELAVFYQPQADAATGRICGFEALVRWRHPERGLLGPDRFVPLAEECGLIGALGEQVLRRACADATRWPATVSVAVNLSAVQLENPGVANLVHEVLLETGLPAHRLELEITETALTRDLPTAVVVLRRLKALGVRVAMDDFGTGYSSLSHLHAFPFDKIKVDKSFVDGIGKQERSTVIVRSVLGIGRGLGIPVVAEGVETTAQREFLRAEGCQELQGYLIGRPAPIEAYADLLDAADRSAAA